MIAIALDSLALDCLSSLTAMRSSEAGCCRDTASLTSHVVVRGRRVKRGFRSERMLTLAELKERPPGGKKLKGGKYQRSCLHDDITVRHDVCWLPERCCRCRVLFPACCAAFDLPKMPTRLS